MSSHVQTLAALALVALAAGALLWRWWRHRGSSVGHCASCPPDKFKARLK